MKSSRKIWSVPIAVLALALMLIGGMVASGVVRAQTVDNETFYMIVGAGAGLEVTVEGLDRTETDDTGNEDNANGKSASISTADDAVTLTNSDGTAQTDFTVAAAATTSGGTTNAETQVVTITPAGGDAAPDAGVYNLRLTVNIDLNDDNNRDDEGDATDDNDRTLTSSVTIYVVGAPSGDDRVPFHAASETAFEGERVSAFGKDLRNSPQFIQITGLGPNSKIAVDPTATGLDEGVLASEGGLDFIVDPNDGSKIIAQVSDDPVADTATIDFNISVDPDTTDDTDTALVVPVQASLTEVEDIDWLPTAEDGTTVGPPFSFTMLSNDPAGTVVGEVDVSGAANAVDVGGGATTGEFLDGILLASDGSAQRMFSVRGGNGPPTGTTPNATLQIVYSGNGSLTTGTMTFRLSVNGDSGIAHRTISNGGPENELNNVTITVNPVNEGPMGPDTYAARVTETVEGLGILADDDEVADLSGLATDTNALIYDLVTGDDSGLFDIDSRTGVVTVDSTDGIADNDVTSPAVADNPVTTDVNEAKAAVYGRVPDDGGELVDPSSLYSDITYEFTVNVSDGNAASSHNIAVTLTVDVNEPVTETGDIAGDEPSYETTDVQNHVIVDLNDYLTGSDSGDDDIQYKWTVTPVNPPFGIYDGSIRVNYPGPSRAIADNPATTDVDESWDPEEDGWTIRVLIGDAFANGSGPDACEDATTGVAGPCAHDDLPNGVDAVLDFTIKQIPGPPLQSFDLVFDVDENAAAGTSVGTLNVEGATTYAVISGTGGARDDFAVDTSTGEITVVNPRDYDAEGAENNIVLLVDAFGENGIRLGAVIAGIAIQDIDEDPVITDLVSATNADGEFDALNSEVPWVYETAQIGDPVLTKPVGEASGSTDDDDTVISAMDPEGAAITYSISSTDAVPFSVNASTGALTVSGALDRETAMTHTFTVRAADPAGNDDTTEITVHVANSNEAPIFTSPLGDAAVTTIPENTPNSVIIFTFTATDEDGDDLEFNLREGQSRDLFVIENAGSAMVNGVEVWSGELRVKTDVTLDYEDAGYDPRVHVEANDPQGLNATLLLTVNLSNVNDNEPAFDSTPATQLSVAENTVRGTTLANYSATDADGDTVTYSLGGGDAGSFSIDGYGNLMTLESLDADRQVPCGSDGCSVMVIASDGTLTATADVRITVTAVEDSVSTLDVSKANPVPGTEMGNPMSALSNAKDGGYEYLWNQLDCAGMLDLVGASDNAVNRAAYCQMWDGMTDANQKKVRDTYIAMGVSAPAESPYDLPATYGSSPLNFVETAWANWGAVLRIEVTAEAPDASCGNGNQCVVINVNSDSADDSIKLEAYRVDTPAGSASKENHYVAALMLVELSSDATPGTDAVFAGVGGGVAALKVDEEDEVEVEFGNLRDTIDVENEAPEVSNFAPEHERAFDDPDVDYTFTVTDDNSGLPEPEDL
ncbi:MAG: cadherin domain-containing protein, partial [Chloroflexi bacterium]|nr:cadherin domain-containing protein [Chloroflexota bacterium]